MDINYLPAGLSRWFCLGCAALAGATFPAAAAATTPYSHGDPTNDEQYMLELINRGRANPAAEGQRLINTTDADVRSAITFFNVNTSQVVSDFNSYAARPPLAFNAKLIAAARAHSADMIAYDAQSHVGSDNSTPGSRVTAAGYTNWNAVGENIYAYSKSVWYAHAGFAIDWDVPSLGHRMNLYNFGNSPVFTEIGLGILASSDPAKQVGPLVVTEDLALNISTAYLVGVVYRDANGDGAYTPGEGMAGVTIMPSTGNYYAVTSASGGYAIPITGLTGAMTLTASGGGLAATETRSVTIGAPT